MFEFNPERFPDSLLTKGLPGKAAYFIIMLLISGIICIGAGTFIFKLGIIEMSMLALIVAFIGTRSSLEALAKKNQSH